ncbi:MAG: AMP-binding protein, partial [Desulfobulbus sp.]|nr:AMP-binding protein [Desulfobulbus sp.]
MQFPPVRKDVATLAVRPNLLDYPATCAGFSWEAVRAELTGLPDGGLNIAHEAVDRHAGGLLAGRVAVRLLGRDDTVHDLTYAALKEQSSRFANLLQSLGVAPGERVFWLAGRSLELYAVFFGTLKLRAVFCPLFAAFGPEPISQRLARGNARVLVTTTRQYERKIKALIDTLTELDYILLVDAQAHVNERVRSLPHLMAEAAPEFAIPPTDPEDPAI